MADFTGISLVIIMVRRSKRAGEGNGNPLQYPCLENPVDGGAWQAAVPGVTKSWTRLSNYTHTHTEVKGHQKMCLKKRPELDLGY